MVLKNVERPMLEIVLDRAEGNQTVAAQMLGINRNTLRKKLTQLKIVPKKRAGEVSDAGST